MPSFLKPYLFAETAFHHEGDFEYLKQQIQLASQSGADGLKFQCLIRADGLVARSNPSYPTLANFVFTKSQWLEAFGICERLGLDVILMPLDDDAFELLQEMTTAPKFLEIHPVLFLDARLKERFRQTGIPIILGAGGRTPEELDAFVDEFGAQLSVIMSGFQAYPSRLKQVKLMRIKVLAERFPHLRIGYADHSGYADPWAIESLPIAMALGASVFEKHLTLDEGVKRTDFESAIAAEKFERIRKLLDSIYSEILAEPAPLELFPEEVTYRNRQKCVVAACYLNVGDTISQDTVCLRMHPDGEFFQIEEIVGRRLRVSLEPHEPLLLTALE